LLLKKVKNVTKKEKFFLFLKNLSVLFVKLLPFREQKKSRQLLAICGNQAGHRETQQTNSQAQAETYGISGRRRAPEGLSRLLRQRP